MSAETLHPCHCGKLFTSPSALIQHQASHHTGPPRRCPHCHKRFASTSSLLQHQETHTTARPPNTKPSTKMPPASTHLCPHCNKRFASASALHQHQKSSNQHHQQDPQKPSWCCHQCGKTFTSALALLQHREVMHEGKQKCRCECGKRFKSKEGMAQHRRESKVHVDTLDVERLQGEEEEVRKSGVGVKLEVREVGGVLYDRFSEIAVGTSGITPEDLRSCQQLPLGEFARTSAKTRGGIDCGVEKMDLPLDVVAGLKGLVRFVKDRSGSVDDDVVDPGEQEGRTSAVLGFWDGGGRDLIMCDEECGWCGECGDEYRP